MSKDGLLSSTFGLRQEMLDGLAMAMLAERESLAAVLRQDFVGAELEDPIDSWTVFQCLDDRTCCLLMSRVHLRLSIVVHLKTNQWMGADKGAGWC